MKNLLLVALCLVGFGAHADSPKLFDLLRMVKGENKLPHSGISIKRRVKIVKMDQFGSVSGAQCYELKPINVGFSGAEYVGCVNVVRLARLSSRELQNVFNLIESARFGEIIPPSSGGASCAAFPTDKVNLTAENGSVLLESGTEPCGSIYRNESKEAEALSESLRSYMRDYENIFR